MAITTRAAKGAPLTNAELDTNFTDLVAADTTTLNSAKAYAEGLVVGLWEDMGSYNASVNTYPTVNKFGGPILQGDIWTISDPGVLGGNQVDISQTLRALVDAPGQTPANWASGGTIGLDDSITNGVTTRAPSQNAVFDALALKQTQSAKDASGGYAGLTAFALNLKNALGTFTNLITSATTAARTWAFPDKDGTVAMLSDITGAGTLTQNPVTVATAGQTVFTVNGGYPPGLLRLYVNGWKMPKEEFSAVNGTTYTMVTPCIGGEEHQTDVLSNQAMGATSTIVRISPVAATDNQTVFPIAGGYVVGTIVPLVRGIPVSDFTANDGANVVFTTGLATGTEVSFLIFTAMPLANAIPSTGGAASGPITVPAGATGNQVPRANEVYQKSSILGTVSQSGGIPTGALFESIINANGRAYKYADGTLICVTEGACLVSTTGSVVHGITWTFPAPFVGYYVLSGGFSIGPGTDPSTYTWSTTYGQQLAASVTVQAKTAASVGLGLMAIGRWF